MSKSCCLSLLPWPDAVKQRVATVLVSSVQDRPYEWMWGRSVQKAESYLWFRTTAEIYMTVVNFSIVLNKITSIVRNGGMVKIRFENPTGHLWDIRLYYFVKDKNALSYQSFVIITTREELVAQLHLKRWRRRRTLALLCRVLPHVDLVPMVWSYVK